MSQILGWADAHYEKFGDWPTSESGRIPGSLGETWKAVQMALLKGMRGLPGGSSIARLLAEQRGKRNIACLPRYTKRQILAWADAHRRRTGQWPTRDSGQIADAPKETWKAVETALVLGRRGLPGGSSLARFLAEHRGKRNHMDLPRLSIAQILAWADAHYRRSGEWPTERSGPVQDAAGETWSGVDGALMMGVRGLPGRSSLPQLLAEHRGVRNIHRLPRLAVSQVLRWADAFHRRTGRWPNTTSGAIDDIPGETWSSVNFALIFGRRGLPKSTLSRLLADKRGMRHRHQLPRFSIQQILRWADRYHRRAGLWPNRQSGPIDETAGETWAAIAEALRSGHRGLPGGTSLARLLAEHRGVRNIGALPRFTIPKILAWADAFYRRTGCWPNQACGRIAEVPDESWAAVDNALAKGLRGLASGSSLAQLLAASRGVRHRLHPPSLTARQILAWADAHHAATGRWPTHSSGLIAAASGETWRAIDNALRNGRRGLIGHSSLSRLLDMSRR